MKKYENQLMKHILNEKYLGEEEERISKTLLERVLRGRENPKTTLTRWVCE